ncbi:MAG TPA: hypothetical protein VK993_04460 [Chthoniobacterales bacterium]|nr:hypothetical protein [Chthoniobacterales bacterium]
MTREKRIRSITSTTCAAAIALLLGGSILTALETRAELPPQAYRQRQATAPEVLVIKVRSVTSKETQRPDHKVVANTVEAVVEHVARTARDLKPGTIIQIFYTQRRYNQPIAGPSEVPTLKEGEVRPAYLAWVKETEVYSPAAGGYSFTKVEADSR